MNFSCDPFEEVTPSEAEVTPQTICICFVAADAEDEE